MFSRQFETDLATWRKTRPQYFDLLQAIKAGEPSDKLAELADDAGTYINEVVELKILLGRASAPNTKSRAAKYEKLQTELDSLTAKVQAVDKSMNLVKTSLERDELECQLYDLVETRQKLQMQLADSSVAAGCVAAAREAGVI